MSAATALHQKNQSQSTLISLQVMIDAAMGNNPVDKPLDKYKIDKYTRLYIVAHCNKSQVFMQYKHPRYPERGIVTKELLPQHLANQLAELGLKKVGLISLVSCEAGQDTGDETDSYAQAFSRHLYSKHGINCIVHARTLKVGVFHSRVTDNGYAHVNKPVTSYNEELKMGEVENPFYIPPEGFKVWHGVKTVKGVNGNYHHKQAGSKVKIYYKRGQQHTVPVDYKRTGGCYISTATCRSLDLSDTCQELELLRWFRDEVLMRDTVGRSEINAYYSTAPAIVAAIDARGDADKVYRQIFDRYLLPAICAVRQGEFTRAHKIYRELVFALGARYLTKTGRGHSMRHKQHRRMTEHDGRFNWMES